jgi:hypothetical protein
MIDRRTMIGFLLAGIPAVAHSTPAKIAELIVYKSPYCGCCGAWVEHIKASGLKAVIRETEDVGAVAAKLGVPEKFRSCHTATIGGYFVEGHVPAADIQKLLKERPKARGIAVPGMPAGAPGMEQSGRRDAYATLIIDRGGVARVFTKHNLPAAR